MVVVGAGPAGLCMTRRLAETDARFTVLERNADVGGIWDIDAPGSPMYESAHFISSKTLSGFPDLPMPEDYPDYPNHRQILAYIRSYADRFDLRSHIQFDTGVVHAALDQDGSWQLELTDGRRVRARYLVCANGVTWEPNVISWPGRFDGEIRHSVTYRDASEFAGKRVLVVGAGNSGVDIACDAAFAADQAFHRLGMPEGLFAMAQCCVYLASAPKSNAAYRAFEAARRDISARGALPVPLALRNAPTAAMKAWGYGAGYRYPHDEGGFAEGAAYLPDALAGARYYEPTDAGFEARIKARLAALRAGPRPDGRDDDEGR